MESLIKQINYRVKGTEMFWNDPAGAEVILPVRAAALSDDCRLSKHLQTRPGSPFTRPPKPPKAPAELTKAEMDPRRPAGGCLTRSTYCGAAYAHLKRGIKRQLG